MDQLTIKNLFWEHRQMYPRGSYLAAFSPVNPTWSPQPPYMIDMFMWTWYETFCRNISAVHSRWHVQTWMFSGSHKKLTANVSSLWLNIYCCSISPTLISCDIKAMTPKCINDYNTTSMTDTLFCLMRTFTFCTKSCTMQLFCWPWNNRRHSSWNK